MRFGDRCAVLPEPGGPPGAYRAAFDDTWLQGPGVYGGLTAAAIHEALRAHAPPGQRLRSMALQYAAAVAPTEATIEVSVDRAGSTTTFLSARLGQEGKVAIQAHATFGRDRATALDEDRVPRPPVPAPESLPELPYVPGIFPVFLQHLELRFAAGAAPFGGAERAEIGLWLRLREPGDVGWPELLGLLDTPPPAMLARARGPRPASTVTFQLHAFELPPSAPGAWWYADTTSRVTVGGWSDEEIRLFGPDGRLAAIGRQLVALVR